MTKQTNPNAARKAGQITIRKIEVALEWEAGEHEPGDRLGIAVHTVTDDQMEAGYGPVDGEQFEFAGQKYRLGAHDYSTDQPGNGDDATCTCSAAIYAVEAERPDLSSIEALPGVYDVTMGEGGGLAIEVYDEDLPSVEPLLAEVVTITGRSAMADDGTVILLATLRTA